MLTVLRHAAASDAAIAPEPDVAPPCADPTHRATQRRGLARSNAPEPIITPRCKGCGHYWCACTIPEALREPVPC